MPTMSEILNFLLIIFSTITGSYLINYKQVRQSEHTKLANFFVNWYIALCILATLTGFVTLLT